MFWHLVGSIYLIVHHTPQKIVLTSRNARTFFFCMKLCGKAITVACPMYGESCETWTCSENQLCNKIQPCPRWNEERHTVCETRTVSRMYSIEKSFLCRPTFADMRLAVVNLLKDCYNSNFECYCDFFKNFLGLKTIYMLQMTNGILK